MSSHVRVAYVGDAGVRGAIEDGLGEEVALVPADPHAITGHDGFDCVLCVGSLPEALATGEGPPTVVLVDEEDAATEARLAGARVLPAATADRPDVLLAQIEAAIERPGTMIDTVTDVVYAFDDTGLTYWNDRLPAVTGLTDGELASMRPVDLFEGSEADRIASLIDGCEPGELPVTVEAELPGLEGRTMPYEFTSSRLVAGDGSEAGVCGVGRDVTEYKRTTWTLERLLEATRDLMASEGEVEAAEVAVSASDRVLGLSHAGIHFADDAGERLEPAAYTDAVEDSLGTVPTLERGGSLAWEVFEAGEGRVFEGVDEERDVHNPDTHLRSEMIFPLGEHGVLIVASDRADAFDDADVYFTELLATTITAALDRAAREGALAEKNARLEEFVGVVSHDLRNPLTVAEGSASLARETGDLGHLDQVSESHRRIREIIEGLLVLAREGKTVGETRPVILGTVAREAWANVDTDGATLVVGDDRTVEADRNRLTQLFENAFRNSVEHGSTNGRPKADDADPDVTVTVEATPEGFAISDDGAGVPADEREAALEPGYSTEEGTGFGLVIIRNIAEGHGWGLVLGESDAGGLRIELATDGKGHSGGGR